MLRVGPETRRLVPVPIIARRWGSESRSGKGPRPGINFSISVEMVSGVSLKSEYVTRCKDGLRDSESTDRAPSSITWNHVCAEDGTTTPDTDTVKAAHIRREPPFDLPVAGGDTCAGDGVAGQGGPCVCVDPDAAAVAAGCDVAGWWPERVRPGCSAHEFVAGLRGGRHCH